MEQVLEVDARPYDPRYPVRCMDEQPVRLLKATRVPIPATHAYPRRVDYEYEPAGTAGIFLFGEPPAGWRQVSVREQRTKVDWAQEMEQLLRTRYASAEKVIWVSAHLNTHPPGAFYQTFAPEQARALVRRLDFCHTPRHGSWLNIAENERRALTRQCLTGRRLGTITELREQTTAWHEYGNEPQRSVDGQFTVGDARVKLKSIYPKLEM